MTPFTLLYYSRFGHLMETQSKYMKKEIVAVD